MVEVIYNLSYDYGIPILDGDECSIVISSDDNTSCKLVYDIILNVFSKKELVFKASGLQENITEVIDIIPNCKPIYFEGDRKIFVKRQPEIYAKISDKKIIDKILDSWVSTIYERRFIYLPKEGQINHIFDILEKNVYSDSNNILNSWKYLDCLIENSPDAPNHNTFVLTFRKENLKEIKLILGEL